METILAGHYQIVRDLRGGGFGQTFLAKDTHLPGNPLCVVKQFKPKLSDSAAIATAQRLFDREAQTLYRLGNHDQIPRLLAHFEQSEEFYLVQEYIEGQPLDGELTNRKQLDEASVKALLQDILQVLAFVHQQNVIHRDIKPSNLIRRSRDGKIVLIDFGAVKEVSAKVANTSGQTTLTVAIGSPGYMPSEQQSGQPHFSSDIYAVGMLCLQALTGLNPAAKPRELPTDSRGEFSCKLLSDRAKISPSFAAILDKMVRYDYRQRYQSAAEALQALEQLLNPRPIATTTLMQPHARLEQPEGRVSLDSEFYVERPPIESDCYEAILKPGALIRVKAPGQMGKTSLMSRILDRASQYEHQTASLNFQLADAEFLTNLDQFLQWFCASIAWELNREDKLDVYWKGILGSKNKCTNYFQRYLLSEITSPLVLGLDEVDLIFQHPDIATDFFGLLRTWHERGKNEAFWKKLKLVIVHSKEVYIPLNINQSPFNGTSNITPEQWYAGMIDSIVSSLNLYETFDLESWWYKHSLLTYVQRFSRFIESILLPSIPQNIVIFIDEIDSILSLNFPVDDFLAAIKACYNYRADKPAYRRLTFALLGVATPSDLIQNRNRSTPFNIGRAIELTGFQWHEVQPLSEGLDGKVSRPLAVLAEVLNWTGGQPFITQKLCRVILASETCILAGSETECIEELVRAQIIDNWETQDEPEHLRTIRDRILYSSQRKDQLLLLYRQILQSGEIPATNKPDHMELRLTGLVVKQQGKLKVYNRIYAAVFNQTWVENALAEAGLLLNLAEKPIHSKAEIQTLEQAASVALQQFEFQEIEALLSAMQAGQALKGLVGEGCLLQDYPTITPLYALQTILDNIHERNQFKVHQGSINCVSFSPDGQCLALIGENGTARLWNLSGQQLAQFYGHQGRVKISFSPDGQRIATAGGEGTVQFWNLSGQHLAQFDTHQDLIRSVKFSPNGQLIATAGGVSTVQLWNLSGRQLAQWNTGQEKVLAVSFNPDGQRLATSGWDSTVRLWDLSGRLIAQWKGNQGEITSMSFSPDGQCLATSGEDNTVQMWRVEGLDELLSRGCEWLKDYLATHPEKLEKLEVCVER